ncbi:MAG: hypothetical protein IPM42_11210 [Saprospiraceae bacterium]|nr:hypothetical protein [Saprospiraceae bacterium]
MEELNEYSWVTVRTYSDPIIANLMASELHNRGVESHLEHDSNVLIIPGARIELKVKESDVDYSLEIIEAQEGL